MTPTPEPKILTGTAKVQVTFLVRMNHMYPNIDAYKRAAEYKVLSRLTDHWPRNEFEIGPVTPAEAVGETGESNNGNDD